MPYFFFSLCERVYTYQKVHLQILANMLYLLFSGLMQFSSLRIFEFLVLRFKRFFDLLDFRHGF